MGIYIFNWKTLKDALVTNKEQPGLDFGKHIIPYCRDKGSPLYAYEFNGYWKDVGTLTSYWEANMELIDIVPEFNLYEEYWKIYTKSTSNVPQYFGPDAEVHRAYITQGCSVEGEVRSSVLFTGAKVGKGAKVIDSVLMNDVVVEDGAVVTRALVADGVKIGKGAVVGSADSENILLVAKRVKGVE